MHRPLCSSLLLLLYRSYLLDTTATALNCGTVASRPLLSPRIDSMRIKNQVYWGWQQSGMRPQVAEVSVANDTILNVHTLLLLPLND